MLQKLRNDYAAAKLKAAEEERQRQQREQLLLVSKNNLHGNRDFIYAISKKNFKVFHKMIHRGDEVYERGRAKYLDLSFKYWIFI